uniref:Uncharacterized protein n=1 Tax=viral metagenome TaxID=1070528 RepID=A0A6M3IJ51_9ZZZZ
MDKRPSTQAIRAAVKKHRPSMANATDDELWRLWTAIPEYVQAQYLTSGAIDDSVRSEPDSNSKPGQRQTPAR